MLAVIETGGKQYLISPQQKIRIEKIKKAKEGEEIIFDKVLLLVDDEGEVKIGQPYLEGVKVKALVKKEGRSKKIIVFHYHPKTRYRKKKGHRQPFMEVEAKNIEA
ncbi:MAG: 50S ribosomal protein L21 [Candidatus Paceibacterota bacterium]|jgi:large subunit ribosomal protein L21|nr:50S ribosomal protein L21 [Candidatus Paceibacterota bacterium]MDD3548491.1 50S ribosomal protein L21 [Candidatus Paceibacterota bacterium]MDD4999176.1 50S ribosomal protein L21 [Candidatus Paceibacterota bacterium]MDD5545246.1 50S ribosomal protein L21 [Candidatus Paceibacterota bacterium]